MGSDGESDLSSLYNLLEQKERDLLLAAELGKALLEKNEELSQTNEKMAEDFSHKLEELEQEKYHLRRRLQAAEEEMTSELTTSKLILPASGKASKKPPQHKDNPRRKRACSLPT